MNSKRQLEEMRKKRKIFVEEYLKDLNATQAAIRAGYSERSARRQGHILLTEPAIADAVAKHSGKLTQRNGSAADQVVTWFLERASLDPADMFDEHGELLPVKAMPEHVRRNVESYEMTKYGPKVKLQSRQAALDSLAKYHQLFLERHHVEHSGAISLHFDFGAATKPPPEVPADETVR